MRSGLCLPLRPTTSPTSRSINSGTTPSPTPTLSASKPSLAAPTSSPSASWICGGNALSTAATVVTTFGPSTFFMAVPPVSDGLHSPKTLPTATDGAGGPPLKVLRDLGQPPAGSYASDPEWRVHQDPHELGCPG